MSSELSTIYRFYPSMKSNKHFSAIETSVDKILQVKPTRKNFKNLEEWVSFAYNESGLTNLDDSQLTFQEDDEEEDASDILDEMDLRGLVIAPMTVRYPPSTLLRFYPDESDTHYTGVSLKDGAILQQKPDRKSFDSLEKWLASLPGSPSVGMLDVQQPNRKRMSCNNCGGANAIPSEAPLEAPKYRDFTIRERLAYQKWKLTAEKHGIGFNKELQAMYITGVDENNPRHKHLCRILENTELEAIDNNVSSNVSSYSDVAGILKINRI